MTHKRCVASFGLHLHSFQCVYHLARRTGPAVARSAHEGTKTFKRKKLASLQDTVRRVPLVVSIKMLLAGVKKAQALPPSPTLAGLVADRQLLPW